MTTTRALPICEMFTSWQGEGLLTGTASVFLRVGGCPLRCAYCDTSYAWRATGAESRDVLTLVDEISHRAENPTFPQVLPQYGDAFMPQPVPRVTHVVITGGEPMCCPAIVSLSESLKSRGFHLTIETSATRFLAAACDLWSLSPKLRNAWPDESRYPVEFARHRAACIYTEKTLRRFVETGGYQLKFVVDMPDDMLEILAFMSQFSFLSPDRVLLMPQGKTPEECREKETWLGDEARQHGFGISPRAHLSWFGGAGRF